MDISIIILNYKTRDLVLRCIDSIEQAGWELDGKYLRHEIIVIDNDSRDELREFLPRLEHIRFFESGGNIGMGSGNNIGIRKASGKYLVIMNPDTIAFKDTFIKLYRFMEDDKRIGVAGPKQLYPDQSIQASCYRWPSLLMPIFRRTPLGKLAFARNAISSYLMEDFDHLATKDVDWLLGSFLFTRKEAMDKVGLFDERFWMYFEDTDLCRRFHNEGWRVVYYPEAIIIHDHKRESASVPWYNFFTNRMARQHVISWFKYLMKWGINPQSKL